ncbi:ComF family protein [Legionella adelaidensis]|uniref:ComF family protein n=1 Tax=Legionella adelaidensis TaxID=45056 RepID=UPI001041013E|nr:ComF family protein [Legionella adelaidensis]
MDSMQAAYYFTEPLRSIMHEFKYKGGIYLTQFLAELMLEKTPETILHSECFIPIPLHYKKLRQRGFNQAAELAKYLGKVLGIPVELNCCKKQIMTPAQAELRGVKRRQNLRDVFSISSITYKNITLIDDIITTGSTLNELARMIKKNSAITIHAWGCAKAV